jgi:hypothetical protein
MQLSAAGRSSKRMLERRQLLSYCGLAAVSFKEKILAQVTVIVAG